MLKLFILVIVSILEFTRLILTGLPHTQASLNFIQIT